jgi:hypothetical protein
MWKARKTIAPFSALPTNLGNRLKIASKEEAHAERFPHSLRPGYDCYDE